jgi:predicted O-methyltransferase YrrM
MTMRVVDGKTEGVGYRTRWDFGRMIDDHELAVGVELGVETGTFSRHLLATSGLKKLYTVDRYRSKRAWWDDIHHRTAACYLKEFGDRVEWMVEDSVDAAERFNRHGVDFIYLDANHRRAAIRRDLRHWWDKVRPGGIVSGHDWLRLEDGEPGWTRVRHAVSDWCADMDVTIHLTSEPLASWWLVKGEG